MTPIRPANSGHFVVKNIGNLSAGFHYSGIYFDQPADQSHYIACNTISSLAAGASQTFTQSISTAGLSAGQHTLYIKEDYWFNGVSESNETNNVRTITFTVGSGSTPAPE